MVVSSAGARFDSIKLVWRPLPHTERLIVGTLSRAGDSFRLEYDGPDVERAKKAGFQGYHGLPLANGPFNGQAMVALGARNPSSQREDYGRLMGFWRVPEGADPFTVIGLTGGTLPTDLFELIAEFLPVPGTEFVTSLAGLKFSESADALRNASPGDSLELEPDPANQYDPSAVRVLFDGKQVAFIKKVHSAAIGRALAAGLKVSARLERAKINGVVQEVLVAIRFD